MEHNVAKVENYFEAVKWAFDQGDTLKCSKKHDAQLITNIIEMLIKEHISISYAQSILSDTNKIMLMITNL